LHQRREMERNERNEGERLRGDVRETDREKQRQRWTEIDRAERERETKPDAYLGFSLSGAAVAGLSKLAGVASGG
jgi:hypothetical protein